MVSNFVEIMEQLAFEDICNLIKELPIDNVESLHSIVDLIYDKAEDDPNFSKTAALMTRQLAGIKVSANDFDNPHKTFNFLKFMLERSQMEFEKNWKNGKPFYRKMKDLLEECTHFEIKKQLLFMIEKEERRFKIKALGNIRFIGELFKQSLLIPKIMVYCMLNLLKSREECGLECLCQLLKMIGKQLESTLNISKFFIKLQEILDEQDEKISSYTSDMLQDVIQLRNFKWVPCSTPDREAEDVEETQEEHDEVQPKMDTMISDSNGKHIGCDYQSNNNQPNNNSNGSTVDPLRLPPVENIILGSKSLFEQWAQGSNVKTHMATYSNKMSYSSMMAGMYTALQVIKLHQGKIFTSSPKNKENVLNDAKKEHKSSQ